MSSANYGRLVSQSSGSTFEHELSENIKPRARSTLLSAFLSAIAQHSFYSHFNLQQVDQSALLQVWVIHIGTAFAFLFKTTMARWSWFCFQSTGTRLEAIDAILDVIRNPLKFFNRELLLEKQILILLALLS
jgi:hypothetical protein